MGNFVVVDDCVDRYTDAKQTVCRIVSTSCLVKLTINQFHDSNNILTTGIEALKTDFFAVYVKKHCIEVGLGNIEAGNITVVSIESVQFGLPTTYSG